MARTPRVALRNVDDIVRECRARRIASLVQDVEPIVAAWRTDADELGRGIDDVVLTDGLLAFRIKATFLHWVPTDAAPVWPRLQAAAGRALLPLLFRTDPSNPSGPGRAL